MIGVAWSGAGAIWAQPPLRSGRWFPSMIEVSVERGGRDLGAATAVVWHVFSLPCNRFALKGAGPIGAQTPLM